ncbi:MAG: efflux RND transporter periplasmic adaptor subunit [Deltaproteobacteria bacterium]|nr:efflux RND transporter periplasmic adaptor subunit [Deltaproteobacteria bacterium]MBW2068985.1 efflux RND transporter periplasmic adaptor subunit [Deltaproteobacteria bacterium]
MAILSRKVILCMLLMSFLMMGCERGGSKAPSHQARIPEVSVVTVKPQDVELTTILPGRTSAFRIAEIRPQVSGLLMKRYFKEGSDVKAGDLLYLIDPAPFEAALENAKAALAKAEANLPAIQLRVKRYRELLKTKAVSEQNYDDAVAALGQARAEIKYWKAQVRTAKINLGYTRITAPISGRIGPSYVTEGAIVTAYQPTPLATIHQLDPIYVDVPQSTAQLLRLKKRLQKGVLSQGKDYARVKLILEDGTVYPHEGTFQFQDVSVDPTTGSVTLRIIFPNPERTLLPKMFVRAVIKEGIRKDAILIPQESVLRTPKGEPYVLIVGANGRVELRMIQIDRDVGDKWLVDSGLSPGDRIIVRGIQFVRPGMQVKVVPLGKNFKASKARGKQGSVKDTDGGGGE